MFAATDSEFQLNRYDAEAIAAFYRPYPVRVWWRCLAIFVPLFLLFVQLQWDKKTGRSVKQIKQRAVQIRKLLTRLGPAFIKIGQALSTRPDVVPPVLMDELSQLQDQLPAFPNERAFQLIREELGANPTEIYAEISDSPIAAASLGQVYKGKLHTGEQVAIKVQRPDISEGIALDMYILRGLAIWSMQTFSFIRSDLKGILEEFASRIFEEMDYNLEGANAEHFGELYGQLEEIYVPKIYWGYTAKRVLTMEWIEGTKLTDIEKIKAQGFDSRHIIEVGVQCSLRQLLDHGFFHADPHPGNLLVMPDGKLAYLDFGMMSSVESEQRYGLIEAIVHLVNRDFNSLSKDYIRLGFLTEDVDISAITPALAEVFNESLGNGVAELDFKGMTDQLSQIMYDYPFRVPAYYALIIRSLVTLEGIALSVDPNFKVLAVAYPYVANRLLTDESSELRNSLKDLLFRNGDFRWTRLENLLRNAKPDEKYDLKRSLDQVVDFLLSERGEFMREHLADELVRGIEDAALKRLPNPFASRKSSRSDASNVSNANNNQTKVQSNGQSNGTQDPLTGFDHLVNIWSILQKQQHLEPMDMLPIAGRILLKSETQEMGRQVVSQLAQRALARLIREMVTRDEEPVGTGSPSVAAQAAQADPFASSKSPISRQLNGRSW